MVEWSYFETVCLLGSGIFICWALKVIGRQHTITMVSCISTYVLSKILTVLAFEDVLGVCLFRALFTPYRVM